MSNLFNKLTIQAFRAGITPRTKESREWFRKRASRISGQTNRTSLMNEKSLKKTNDTIVGNMYMFFYDPKHKDKLPYYDQFPLIFVVGPAKGGFYGLNLHYLPPILRAKFLDSLLDITNNKSYNDSTKLKLSYELLQKSQKFKYFEPCFKHYLTDHVKGNFAMVPATEWEIAIFLPIAQWKGAGKSTVYRDSRNKI